MDLLSEEAETTEGFHITNELIIAFLLWVDDVVSCVEGTKNQETILNKINEFAIKHKISWGQDKCNIQVSWPTRHGQKLKHGQSKYKKIPRENLRQYTFQKKQICNDTSRSKPDKGEVVPSSNLQA